MVWFKVDDTLALHPKAVAAGNTALGLWVRAGAWCSQQLTEGYVPQAFVAMLGGRPRDAQALVDAGLWTREPGGYRFHDWADRNPTREQVQAERDSNRRRQALVRDPELRDLVRERDGDRCRYCAVLVKWRDRRSPQRGTYDHVDPKGPNTERNLVVACGSCNTR